MSPGFVVLVVALVAALAFGSWRELTDGRFRGTHKVRGSGRTATKGGPRRVSRRVSRRSLALAPQPPSPERAPQPASEGGRAPRPPEPVLAGTAWATGLGERATLLQFSSAFCAPCRATRRTLEEVARIVPGVTHIEVDAEHHLDLVRRVGILRTPTTIVLDAAGREVSRAAGAPSKQAVIAGLDWIP